MYVCCLNELVVMGTGCSFLGDWLLAMKYAEKLCRESQWSKAIYTFQKASFLMMCDDQTVETLAHITYLFRSVLNPSALVLLLILIINIIYSQ